MFVSILKQLVTATPGGIGALFLDHEGETVALLSERPFDFGDEELRVIGAYQGIFLTRLRDMCGRSDAGVPQRFKLEFPAARILSCDLKDGYYLVFVTDRHASEAIAWRELQRCRLRLLDEI